MPGWMRTSRFGAWDIDLLAVDQREEWEDEDGHHEVVWRVSPFPYRRKPLRGREAPPRDIPLARLYGSQHYVTEVGLEKWRKGYGEDDLPYVFAEKDGTFTVGDGHHRLVAAWLRGETHARVRISEAT